MAATIRKWKKEIRTMIEAEGAEIIQMIQTKKHFRIVIRLKCGLLRKIFAAVTPSDNRCGSKNLRRDIRKIIHAKRENN